jgi:hypothetical protein
MKKLSYLQIFSLLSVVGLVVTGANYVSASLKYNEPVAVFVDGCGVGLTSVIQQEVMGVESEFICADKVLKVSNRSSQNRWVFDKNGIGYFLKGGASDAVMPKETDIASLVVTNYDPCK